MITKTRKERISLIICICMISLSILTMGIFVVHRDHDCSDYQSTHGCEICFQFDNIMNKLTKLSLMSVIVVSGIFLIQVSFPKLFFGVYQKIKYTPVTLKVKMNN